MSLDENEIMVREFYDGVTKSLPDFLNERAVYSWVRPSFYGEGPETRVSVRYEVPLQEGRTSVELRLVQNLQEVLGTADLQVLSPERSVSLREALSGKKGIIVQGEYRFGFKTGLDQGLCLDVYAQGQEGKLASIRSYVKQEVLNALCEERKIHLLENHSHFSPLSFENREIKANLKDLRLEKLAEAEPHLAEFFSWVSSQAREIQTLLVMGNWYHHLVNREQELKWLDRSGKINLKVLPSYSHHTADMLFGLMNNLHPPQNKRMDYLVHSQ